MYWIGRRLTTNLFFLIDSLCLVICVGFKILRLHFQRNSETGMCHSILQPHIIYDKLHYFPNNPLRSTLRKLFHSDHFSSRPFLRSFATNRYTSCVTFFQIPCIYPKDKLLLSSYPHAPYNSFFPIVI